MALSLKQQLKKLGTADLKGVTETSRKYKASFLFSAKEAADQDMETIFSLARNGFLELINVEPDFAPFEAPLFSENAKAINRVLMSKQENDKLDETLNGFLAQLSPYFLLNAAGKTLEWLIRRFDIHKLNVESILACVLPYHETKPFVKMVSLLDIADNSSWVFLKPIRASSLPLSRELLVERIGKSRFVLDFVCKTVVRSRVGFSTLYTFYAATLVRFIASSRTVSSEMAIALTPYLVDGLQAREQPELQLATYMILSQLSSKTAFNSQAIEALTATLVQHARSSGLFRHAVLALIHLAQTQANFAMGDKAANALIDDAHFQATLLKHAANYAIDRFVAFLTPHFVRHQQFELLDTLVFSGYLASDNIQAVCRAVMDAYMQVGKQDATEFLDLARPLLVTISQRHVEQLDAVLDQSLQAAKDDKAASKALYALSNATLQGTRHQLVEDANTTLYLCLHHPSAHMRLLGIKKLEDVLASSDALNESSDLIEAGLLNSLCEFGESASYVLTKMPETLLAHVPMNAVLDCLLARLQEPGAYEHVCAVQTMVFLLNKAMSQADDDAVLRISRMVALFVFYSGSEAVLSVVQQTKSAKFGNNVVGRMVAHMRTASKNKKESLAYDWVSLEASDAANVDFWASMLTSTSRLDRVVAMVVLGARVAASHQSKDALLLLQGIVDRYASHPLLYTQAMNHENDKNHVLSMAAVNALRTIDVSESQEIQLVQLTLWHMIHQVQDASDAWIQACFDLVVGGPSLGCFETAVAALLAGHLDADLLPFLATQWMEQENHVVKARSLQIGAAYIRAYGLQHAINDFQHLVPALLPCLTHGNGLVRAMAMACFKSIAAAYGSSGLPAMPALYDQKSRDVGKKKPKTSTLAASKIYKDSTVADTRAADISHFVDHMAHFDDEISSDGAYAARALALYYAQGQQHTSKAMRDTTTHVIHFLLAHINASRVVAHQIALLSLLQPLHVGDMLDRVIDLLEATLVAPSASAQTTRLIVALVACYTPGSLAQGKNLDVFLRLLRNPSALEGEDDQGWHVSTRRQALHQITPDFFAACDQKIQHRLFHLLLDIATNGEQHDVRLAKHILLHVALPVTLIDAYLTSTAKMLIGTDDDASTQKGRKRTKNSDVPQQQSVQVDLYELVTVLELIESKDEQGVLLIKPLFEVLTALVNADLRNSPVSLEYINQLVMSSLTRMVQEAGLEKTKMDESVLRVDVVVQCIRVTGNPQTHNQALLLMATIASVFPERVLHNIMPVFTFMGANVLRLDDNYSFQVIQQTLEKVLPPLVAARRAETAGESEMLLSLQVKPIIKVFVDALFHIPKHRRLRLFTVLVTTLGQDQFLAVVLALLLEKFTEKRSKGDRADADTLIEFTLVVCHQFGAATQLKAMLALFQGLLALPNDKSEEDDNENMHEQAVFSVSDHSAKQLRQYKLVTMNLIHQWLASKHFLTKVMAVQQSLDAAVHDDDLQPLFLQAVELVLQIVTHVTAHRDALVQQEAEINTSVLNFWRALLKVVYEVLTKLNALLPLPAFLQVMHHLLKHPQMAIRRKAMTLFHERVSALDHAPEDDELALVAMVSEISAVMQLETKHARQFEKDRDDALINNQAALLCLASLAMLLGELHPQPFVDAIPVLLEDALATGNPALQVSTLASIAVIYQHVGPRGVPHLPKLMPKLLDILLTTENDALLLAAISTLDTLVHVLPHFLSPYLTKMLTGLLAPAIFAQAQKDTQRDMIHQKAIAVLATMATQIPPRILLTPVFQFYEKALANGTQSTLALYALVQQAIQAMPRDMVTVHYKPIFKFFLLAFDMRGSKHGGNEASLVAMEDAIIDTFMTLVMKLNETLFKPLFLKVVDWATIEQQDDENDTRALFFYKLVHALLDKLKSIIAPYVLYIVDDIKARLVTYRDGARVPDTLWNYVILTLQKSFLYDNDNLWNADRYDKIMPVVVDQLSVTVKGDADTYLHRIAMYLVPCIGQMAVTVSNDTLWKPLNHQVLMKTREDDPEIRIAALRVIEEFYNRLGDEWLLFLAESISFLAELMEDDDPRVEKLVQQVNAQIETHLGESLDKFFV